MSTEHKEIVRQLLVDELKGKSFRRQAEFLTDQLVHERFMAGQSLAVAKEEIKLQYAEENRVLDTKLTEYQNLEGAVCPPDKTFQTYFEQLEKQILELQAVKAALLVECDIKDRKIKRLTEENAQLKRRAEACEESKKESTPPPPQPKPETKPEPEPEQEDEADEEVSSEESEYEPEVEGEFEDEDFDIDEEFMDAEAKPAEEVPPMSEAMKAVLALAAELSPAAKEAGPLNFQALLDEALKG